LGTKWDVTLEKVKSVANPWEPVYASPSRVLRGAVAAALVLNFYPTEGRVCKNRTSGGIEGVQEDTYFQ
jgi:hypothetical protein